jgi:hypothetical protein
MADDLAVAHIQVGENFSAVEHERAALDNQVHHACESPLRISGGPRRVPPPARAEEPTRRGGAAEKWGLNGAGYRPPQASKEPGPAVRALLPRVVAHAGDEGTNGAAHIFVDVRRLGGHRSARKRSPSPAVAAKQASPREASSSAG